MASESTITSMLSNISWFGEWLPLAILATITAILFHILLMMFSRAFKMDALERYSKSEMMQVGATALMAIFLVSILVGITDSSFLTGFVVNGATKCKGNSYSYATGDYGMNGALSLIKCRLGENAKTLSDVFAFANADHSSDFDRLTLYISLLSLPVFMGNYIGDWYLQVENYRALSQLSMNLLISVNAQIKFVDYVSQNMLQMFLPLGIILRTFHFTRGIGSFFISMAIGLYFIFPTVFLITDPGFISTSLPSNPSAISKKPGFCYPTFTGAVALAQSSGTQSSSGSSGGYGLSVSQALLYISKIYSGLLLHPFITLAVTLIFVRYMMYILGGQPYDVMRMVARVV
ncbi:MAG: hypothetical protein ABID61_02630 [Candidatus Micrarchaeota archaeon]